MRLVKKKIIYGCDAQGEYTIPYLTRYTLIERTGWQLCLHIFHKSDERILHDHPWPFYSLILWRGYTEETPMDRRDNWETAGVLRKRYWPGMLLFRPAKHTHRVELVQERKAVTLVLMGSKVREWGFWKGGRWIWWEDYNDECTN